MEGASRATNHCRKKALSTLPQDQPFPVLSEESNGQGFPMNTDIRSVTHRENRQTCIHGF